MTAYKYIRVLIETVSPTKTVVANRMAFRKMSLYAAGDPTNLIQAVPPQTYTWAGQHDAAYALSHGFTDTSNYYMSAPFGHYVYDSNLRITSKGAEWFWTFNTAVEFDKIVFESSFETPSQPLAGLPIGIAVYGSNCPDLNVQGFAMFGGSTSWDLIGRWEHRLNLGSESVSFIKGVAEVGERETVLIKPFLHTGDKYQFRENRVKLGFFANTLPYLGDTPLVRMPNGEVLGSGGSPFTGVKRIYGDTTVENFPAPYREVFLLRQETMGVVRRAVSDKNGLYSFEGLRPDKYTVMGVDPNGEQNNINYAHVDLTDE